MAEKKVLTGDLDRMDRIIENLSKSLDRISKRLAESHERTEKQMAKSRAETEKQMAKSRKETDRKMAKSRAEVDKKFKELAVQIEKTDRQINGVKGTQDHRWGQFVESLVAGDLEKLLLEWGIEAKEVRSREIGKTRDQQYEFDLVVENASKIVVVEVKSALSPEDVGYFIGKLMSFKEMFPNYKDKSIYGAVAYLKANENAIKFAKRNRLFVIRATGSSASIINDANFEPKEF